MSQMAKFAYSQARLHARHGDRLDAAGWRRLTGVGVMESELSISFPAQPPYAELPSPEAENCRKLFTEMLPLAAVLAAIAGNLFRLVDEYRRTERRARALEDVLLPEIEETLHDILAHLEDTEMEETIRTRMKYHSGP